MKTIKVDKLLITVEPLHMQADVNGIRTCLNSGELEKLITAYNEEMITRGASEDPDGHSAAAVYRAFKSVFGAVRFSDIQLTSSPVARQMKLFLHWIKLLAARNAPIPVVVPATLHKFVKTTADLMKYFGKDAPASCENVCVKCGHIKGQDFGDTCAETQAFRLGYATGAANLCRSLILECMDKKEPYVRIAALKDALEQALELLDSYTNAAKKGKGAPTPEDT